VTGRDASRNVPGEPETATAAKGTAAPVDVTVDPRARTTIAVFLAGPVISIVHFLVVYLVVEAGCTGDGPGLDVFDPPVPAVAAVVATGVAAVASSAAALWAYRRWRPRQQPDPAASADELVDREPLAFIGFLLSVLAVGTVLLVGFPALVLEACGP
jgi:hypothetical protein